MKQKNRIYILILLFVTLIGMWGIPNLVKKLTYTPDNYPFVYYSSMIKDLCLIDFQNKKTPMQDLKGNIYDAAQSDSLMPLLNYRQLMVEGKLPDSIEGHEITPKIIKMKSVNYKYNPRDFNTPSIGLNVLFEAMPKRVGLELPNDVFRMDDKIEFIDAETNTVDKAKSELFQQAVDKEGYTFPSQWLSGNPNVRKPYDEGYFCLDSKGALFHLKMVNNRPYFKNTHIGDSIRIASFAMYEVSDKRFYGMLFSKEGDMYIVGNEQGRYKPTRLDIDRFDLDTDQVMIMGNLLYWSVSVTTPDAKLNYGLRSETLKRVAEHQIERQPGKWDEVSKWVLPVYLTVEKRSTDYLYPTLHFGGFQAIIVNLVLALLIGIFVPNTKGKRIFNSIYILITGIAGLIALLVLPNFIKKIK